MEMSTVYFVQIFRFSPRGNYSHFGEDGGEDAGPFIASGEGFLFCLAYNSFLNFISFSFSQRTARTVVEVGSLR